MKQERVNAESLQSGDSAADGLPLSGEGRDGGLVPIFKSWTHWYVLVLLFLVLQIIFFYFFTKNFS